MSVKLTKQTKERLRFIDKDQRGKVAKFVAKEAIKIRKKGYMDFSPGGKPNYNYKDANRRLNPQLWRIKRVMGIINKYNPKNIPDKNSEFHVKPLYTEDDEIKMGLRRQLKKKRVGLL